MKDALFTLAISGRGRAKKQPSFAQFDDGEIMTVRHGRVVVTPGAEKPYKVVLELEGGAVDEHPVETVRDGEALIRERSAVPPMPPYRRHWSPDLGMR
jgi:hypothetical protein